MQGRAEPNRRALGCARLGRAAGGRTTVARAAVVTLAVTLLVNLAGCSAAREGFAVGVKSLGAAGGKPAVSATSATAKAAAANAASAATAAAAAAAATAAATLAAKAAASLVAEAANAATAACAGTASGTKHVYVSISKQHLWACTGAAPLIEGAVTTGASARTNVHNATPTGTFRIASKSRNQVLRGRDLNGSWELPVEYWIPFNGNIGFHDDSQQTFPLGSPLYTTQGSHGCVRLSLGVIAAIYAWAPIGTPITVTA